jgi:hypothetical protein
MVHNITPATPQSWSTNPSCRVCKRTFNPPDVGRPQVYCSQACRQCAYRARATSRQARVAAAELRGILSSLNDDFTSGSGNLAAAISAIDDTGAGGPGALPTGWETEVSRTARDLREMLDRIRHLVIDHSQLAYRDRTAMKRLGPAMPESTGAYRDIVA